MTTADDKRDDVGKYTWEDWWFDHGYAVVMVGVLLVGMLVIGLVNGWS